MKFKKTLVALAAALCVATSSVSFAADPAPKKTEKPADKKKSNVLTVTGTVTYEKKYYKGQQVKMFFILSGKKTKNEIAPSEFKKIGEFNHKMVEVEVEGTKDGGGVKITKILSIKEVKNTKVIK